MRDETQKYRLFSRRSIILGGINILLTSTVIGRYFYLQVLHGTKYKGLSEKNHIKLQITPASRGKFLDRNNNELANDAIIYSLGVNSGYIRNLDEIIKLLEDALNRPLALSSVELQRRKLQRHRNSPLILEDNLSWTDLSKVSERLPDIPGADSFSQSIRYYTLNEKAAHITGYIAAANQADIDNNNLIAFSNIKIGKSGLEKFFDATIRGEVGYKRSEVNAYGKTIKELTEDKPINGQDLNLTIDKNLQEFVHDIMLKRNANGAVIVMDPNNGEVIALHSMPSFNPNKFTNGVSQKEWQALIQNSSNPLINNAVSMPYPPGSTFKLVTALAILKAGIDPNRTVNCTGHFEMGGHDFKCWNTRGHGPIDLMQAICQSCNCYFYNMGLVIGINKIAEMARLMGFDKKTGIELPYEHGGLVPDDRWKAKRFAANWFKGDTVNVSIGQGYMLVTPIQLALMTARLVSNKAIIPTLIKKREYQFESLNLDPEHLNIVKTGMFMSCNAPNGIMIRHNMAESRALVGGKTGTAQVVDLKYKNKVKHFAHHALFTGYIQLNPQYDNNKRPVLDKIDYIISIVVAHGEAGSKSAAPIAKQIALKLNGQVTELDQIDYHIQGNNSINTIENFTEILASNPEELEDMQ